MIDTGIFDLLYTHLEESTVNNVRNQLNSYSDYQEAMEKKDIPLTAHAVNVSLKYLKKEEASRKNYRSLQELQLSVFEYIEGYYNSKRPHTTLGMLTLNEAED